MALNKQDARRALSRATDAAYQWRDERGPEIDEADLVMLNLELEAIDELTNELSARSMDLEGVCIFLLRCERALREAADFGDENAEEAHLLVRRARRALETER